jgi:hypothetical protein
VPAAGRQLGLTEAEAKEGGREIKVGRFKLGRAQSALLLGSRTPSEAARPTARSRGREPSHESPDGVVAGSLGRKGELGPIDPIMNLTDPAGNEAPINVEDIMAYLEFIRKRAGLSDQASLTAALAALAEKVPPVALGGIHRAHSHIRAVAQKMLSSHAKPMEDQRQNAVIETLAERTYAHGHAIGRREARDIGLPIAQHDQEVERLMWDLYRQYEDVMKLNEPIEPFSFLDGQESRREPMIAAAVESEWGFHEYGGEVELEAKRALPAQLAMNLNFNLGLPPNINPQQLPQQAQQILQQLVQQVQQQVGP